MSKMQKGCGKAEDVLFFWCASRYKWGERGMELTSAIVKAKAKEFGADFWLVSRAVPRLMRIRQTRSIRKPQPL
jgi:hypothetical protein